MCNVEHANQILYSEIFPFKKKKRAMGSLVMPCRQKYYLFLGTWQVSLRVEGEKLINVTQLLVIQHKSQIQTT